MQLSRSDYQLGLGPKKPQFYGRSVNLTDPSEDNYLPKLIDDKVLGASLVAFLKKRIGWLSNDEAVIRKDAKAPITLARLRISFWKEYDEAVFHNRKMKMDSVHEGVCPRPFLEKIMTTWREGDMESSRLVWLLMPPVGYDASIEEALSKSLERIREILELPLVVEKAVKIKGSTKASHIIKETDPRVGSLILKAFELLDKRVHGDHTQRIEQQNTNLNVEVGKKPKTIEEIDKEIKRLHNETKFLAAKPGEIIERYDENTGEKTKAIVLNGGEEESTEWTSSSP